MKRREMVWSMQSSNNEIWSLDDSSRGPKQYINNITGEIYDEPPPIFRGGLLADDMGLGKTLTTIALIASDCLDGGLNTMRAHEYAKATLLVVPSSLVKQWDDQLQEHVHPSSPHPVRWIKHHGPSRIENQPTTSRYNLIITSYHTLVSEYRKHQNSSSPLFSTTWHRIVLDEAHTIRNHTTLTARAVFALRAHRRWAVTGTPLHNRLSDFSSLLQYLNVYPYADRKTFEEAIVDVWKQGDGSLALERLRRLFKSIAIRRLRSSLQLPRRADRKRFVHFSVSEFHAYREMEAPIARTLDLALARTRQEPGTYMNALVKINRLRQFCNLGESLHKPNLSSFDHSTNTSGVKDEVQAIIDDLLDSAKASCAICNNIITHRMDDDEPTADIYLTECLRLICGHCYLRTGCKTRAPTSICTNHPECQLSKASTSPSIQMDQSLSTSKQPGINVFSSKTCALRIELLNTIQEKSVVFSAWTATLDMIQAMLIDAKIPFTRIDGSVSPRNRAANIHTFQADSNIRVLLLTISCGAEGLNLTAASRVYLMEPQWNPNMEEQILSRVHRLGQQKPVTTVRFIVKDSIEDHVINIQDRKKRLADLLLSQEKGNSAKGNNARLQCLRDLLN